MTNFSFGRTDGRTERGNNNIPELSLESAGINMNSSNIYNSSKRGVQLKPHIVDVNLELKEQNGNKIKMNNLSHPRKSMVMFPCNQFTKKKKHPVELLSKKLSFSNSTCKRIPILYKFM